MEPNLHTDANKLPGRDGRLE